MGCVLVDDEKPVLILHQPVGIEYLTDDLIALCRLLTQKLSIKQLHLFRFGNRILCLFLLKQAGTPGRLEGLGRFGLFLLFPCGWFRIRRNFFLRSRSRFFSLPGAFFPGAFFPGAFFLLHRAGGRFQVLLCRLFRFRFPVFIRHMDRFSWCHRRHGRNVRPFSLFFFRLFFLCILLFWGGLLLLSSGRRIIQRYIRNHFPPVQRLAHLLFQKGIDAGLVRKTHLHLGGMHVHVDVLRVGGQMQQGKGKFMLHQPGLISRFQSLGQQRASDISSVDEEKLKVSVGADHRRASQEAVNGQPLHLRSKRQKLSGDFPSIDAVYDFLQVSVSRCVKTDVPVHHELKRHIRTGQGHVLHQIGHVASFRRRSFQKFLSHRRIKKELSGDHRGSLRRADFRKFLFHTAVQPVMDAGERILCLRDQFHHGNRRNAGKRFPPETQTVDVIQILRRADLAGGMAEKCLSDLILLNAVPIVRHADEGTAAVPDLHRYGVCARVHRVFHQLLHHTGRTLHHLARRDLIYRIAVKQPDLCHLNISFHRPSGSPPSPTSPEE